MQNIYAGNIFTGAHVYAENVIKVITLRTGVKMIIKEGVQLLIGMEKVTKKTR